MDHPFIDIPAPNILSHFPVPVYTTDAKGVISFYNIGAANLWGRKPQVNSPTEQAFSGAWKMYHSDGTAMAHAQCPMALALKFKKSYHQTEITIERPDGSRANVLENINPLFDDNSELIGAVNLMYEITNLKSIEADTYRLAALVESSSDAIIGKNLQGVINSWNRGAEEMFGYTSDEAIGKNVRLIIPDERQEEEDNILAKIRNGEKVESFETIRKSKHGKLIPVSLTISPIKNSSGTIVGASKIARDISMMIKAQNELKHYSRELKRINNSKDDFIAMTSHELKNPLAILKANLQFLESEIPSDSEWQVLIQKSLKQEEKLHVIISNLIDISRIQTGTLSFVFKTFSVNEFLDECIENILTLNPRRKIIREYEPSDPSIYADRIRVSQVLNNLLSNAIKYSAENDPIQVRCYIDGEDLTICVTDAGPGISSDQQERIFDMFFRAKEMRSFPGMGIGLYLSKQIMAAHNGKFWVESEEGAGSSFFASFPIPQTKKD